MVAPKEKFKNNVDITTFVPLDRWILVKSPFQKEGNIYSKDKQGDYFGGYEVLAVGGMVNHTDMQGVVEIVQGMKVYTEPDMSVVQIYEEDVLPEVVEVAVENVDSVGRTAKTKEIKREGYYEYFLLTRDQLMGFCK